jgi:hypothetical protein
MHYFLSTSALITVSCLDCKEYLLSIGSALHVFSEQKIFRRCLIKISQIHQEFQRIARMEHQPTGGLDVLMVSGRVPRRQGTLLCNKSSNLGNLSCHRGTLLIDTNPTFNLFSWVIGTFGTFGAAFIAVGAIILAVCSPSSIVHYL